MEQHRLAVVIPAYKAEFLTRTLLSLADQSVRSFNVYIGDDDSPYDLKTIVDSFEDQLKISYTRFDTNLGGTDLVAQWQRCLNLVRDEEYVCLFSDDDEMESRCVESFLECENKDSDVFHFDLSIIDEEDKVIKTCTPFPSLISTREYYLKLFRHEIDARMPEFIFRRSALNLVPFDLAWRSDTATVMKAAFPGGICTVPSNGENRVRWRASTQNVSGVDYLKDRKNKSNLDFFNWTTSFFSSNNIQNPFSVLYHLKMIVFAIEYSDVKQFVKTGWTFARKLNCVKGLGFPLFLLLMAYRLVYRKFE